MQQAIAAFRQATELDAKWAPAHYNLGLALRQVGQLQLAADAFYQATQADAKFALAYANLGAALLEGSNPNLAEDYLQLQPLQPYVLLNTIIYILQSW